MPTGKFFCFPETMHAGAEAGEGNFWRGILSAETWHDYLFINFAAVVAAVFGDLETYCYCCLCSARGRDDLGEFAVRGSERDEGVDDASMTDRALLPSALVSRSDEDGRGDSESFSQVANLSNVEFAFAGENF